MINIGPSAHLHGEGNFIVSVFFAFRKLLRNISDSLRFFHGGKVFGRFHVFIRRFVDLRQNILENVKRVNVIIQ